MGDGLCADGAGSNVATNVRESRSAKHFFRALHSTHLAHQFEQFLNKNKTLIFCAFVFLICKPSFVIDVATAEHSVQPRLTHTVLHSGSTFRAKASARQVAGAAAPTSHLQNKISCYDCLNALLFFNHSHE
jgi:hypothetical protein